MIHDHRGFLELTSLLLTQRARIRSPVGSVTWLRFFTGFSLNRKTNVRKFVILHDNARSHTAAAVTDPMGRTQWEMLEHPPYSPNMSPCDYDLFAKVKEPLRGTRYNTRDELIRAIGRSIRNINKDGRADGVRRLLNI